MGEKMISMSKLKYIKEKMDKSQEAGSKMSKEKEYIAKFTDDKVDSVKTVVGKIREMIKADVNKDELGKLADQLEKTIVVEDIVVEPAVGDKPVEPVSAEPVVEPEPAEPIVAEPEPKEGDKPIEPVTPEPVVEPEPKEPVVADPVDDASKQSEKDLAYKEIAGQAISKMKELEKLYTHEKETNELLTRENLKLKESVTKFSEENHSKLMESTLTEISKFNKLEDSEIESKKVELSKMSDEALSIMKAEFEKVNTSKLESEPLFETSSSQELDGKEELSKHQESKKKDVDELIKHLNYR